MEPLTWRYCCPYLDNGDMVPTGGPSLPVIIFLMFIARNLKEAKVKICSSTLTINRHEISSTFAKETIIAAHEMLPKLKEVRKCVAKVKIMKQPTTKVRSKTKRLTKMMRTST